MAPTTLLLLVFLFSGSLLIAISVPLIQERIGPNHWYGFRVRRTLEDPKVWYALNAYAAWRLLAVGVAEMLVSVILYLVPDIDVAVYASAVGVVTIAGLILGMIQSFRYMHKMGRLPGPM